MKIKNIKYFSLILLLSLTLSCSEDIIDLRPLDAISSEQIFNNNDLLNSYVLANYNAIRPSLGTASVGLDAFSDMFYYWRDQAPRNLLYNQADLDATNGESALQNLWAHSYGYLKRINTFFEGIENSSLAQSKTDAYAAEMKFVRAYIYFKLSSVYGGVPIITKRYELDDETFEVARSSYDDVIAFVVKELDEAIPFLPESSKTRASKASAMALKARALLYAASDLWNPSGDASKWQAAASANKAVMDLAGYQLAPDYFELFLSTSSNEVIFALEFTESFRQGSGQSGDSPDYDVPGSQTIFWPAGYEGWSDLNPTTKFVNSFEMTNGELPYLADGSVNPASGFDPQNPFVNRDPRFYDIVLYNDAPFRGRNVEVWIDKDDPTVGGRDSRLTGNSATHTGFNIKKSTNPDDPSRGTSSTPDIRFRLTEFYLNYAETQLMLGNEDAARAAINAVRARASVNMPPVTSSGDELMEAYRRERAIELSLEDHRCYDIRRWKIAGEVLGGQKLYATDAWRDASTGTFSYTYDRLLTTNRWDDRLYLFPIPEDEIRKSGNSLTQNPGY